ncbi:MAG: LUD domain-containing protein, partial [Candidatus Njordarchaeota archaeon]
TGANVIAADTGSIFIVENEGNIRFVSNAPPTHIVLTGIEKIVPNVVDGMLYVDVLAKYAGYVAPSYVSVISGPSKTGDIEKIVVKGAHGPEELHVVFLDNGRSKMLKDDIFRQALLCMRCGACLFECPVYGTVCGYFGDYYFGGIGTVYMSFLDGLSKVVPMVYTCMLCGRCREICPMKIDTPNMILELRRRIYRSDLVPNKMLSMLEKTEKNKTPYS